MLEKQPFCKGILQNDPPQMIFVQKEHGIFQPTKLSILQS